MRSSWVCGRDLADWGWDLASRVIIECLTANAEVNPSILRHSGIWGTADEAVLNKVLRKSTKIPLFKYNSQWTWNIFTSRLRSYLLREYATIKLQAPSPSMLLYCMGYAGICVGSLFEYMYSQTCNILQDRSPRYITVFKVVSIWPLLSYLENRTTVYLLMQLESKCRHGIEK